jgi:hypothetical protein
VLCIPQLLEAKQFLKLCVCVLAINKGWSCSLWLPLPDENFNLHNRKAHTANSLCEFTFGKLDLWECAEAGGGVARERERREKVSLAACICALSALASLSSDIITFDFTLYGNLHMHARGIKLMPKAVPGRHFAFSDSDTLSRNNLCINLRLQKYGVRASGRPQPERRFKIDSDSSAAVVGVAAALQTF